MIGLENSEKFSERSTLIDEIGMKWHEFSFPAPFPMLQRTCGSINSGVNSKQLGEKQYVADFFSSSLREAHHLANWH